MRKNINPIIPFLMLCIAATSIIQSCKQNAPVQPNTNNNQSQNPPVLINPQNQVSVQTATPALEWNIYPSATSYRIQVSLDANFAGTILLDTSGITSTQVVIPPNRLSPAVYNYWRVIAAIPGGLSPWSVTWRFNVIFNAPAAPVLLSPVNGSTGQPFLPLFDWSDVATAQFYRIQVSQFLNFSPVLLDSNLIIPSQLQCPIMVLNTNTQYFWRAIAYNNNGTTSSPWSSVWNFTTVQGPEPNSISGRITFADTNFLAHPSYYLAAAYNPASWPPPGNVIIGMDSLRIQKIGNVYAADYKIRHLFNGSYYICVQTNIITQLVGSTQGIYGCDTVHIPFSSCPNNPNPVNITSNHGIENINFLAWADTTKKIF